MPLDLSNFSKPQYDPSELTGGGGGAGLTANTFTGAQTAPDIAVGGITGAAQLMRLVGATTSGAPTTGTFQVGDTVLSIANGKWYTCTVAGTPGTWITPSMAGSSAYDAAVLADTPVAYWLLNDPSGTTAADLTGNGHDGTYTGATYTLAQSGPCADGEKSVFLDGTTARIEVPDAASLRVTGALTMEMWVNPSSTWPAYQFLLDKHSGYPYQMWVFYGALQYTRAGEIGTSTPIGIGGWQHLAVTDDLTTVTYYLNGAAAGTAGSGGVGTDPFNEIVRIGCRADLFGNFAGKMAKVAIYNTALSSGRIAAHYAAR